MRPCRVISSVVVTSTLGLGAIAAGSAWNDAHAQAWVADKGGLDVSLDYNLAISDKVVHDSTEADTPNAGTTTQEITLGGEYVPMERLAVSLALPLALIKYTGDKVMFPHPGGGSYDDGSTHATLTDLRVGARYQLLEDPVALSPHLGVSIPVADYETIGNSVAGRHLLALHLGIGVGSRVTEALYVHLLYEFSLVQKYDRTPETEAAGQNRSDGAFTLGYKLLDQRLDVHLAASARVTHGGIKFSEFPTLSTNELMYHDAILAENIILAGGGLSYQISDTLAANLGARIFITGTNTQNASVFAAGVSWSPL